MHEIGSELTEAAEKRRVKLNVAATLEIFSENTLPKHITGQKRMECC
jgi:hypothetical protein